jgi:hypothetical protein
MGKVGNPRKTGRIRLNAITPAISGVDALDGTPSRLGA